MKFHIVAIVAVLAIASAQDVPPCRATFIDANGNETLINRNDEGDMGCISDDECIQFTGPDSWCKEDGTCRGCEDWTGCCDLGNDPPADPIPCVAIGEGFPGFFFTEELQDVFCATETGCSNSYCQDETQTCYPCDPTPETPPPPVTTGDDGILPTLCLGFGLTEDMSKADGLEYCKSETECPDSYCVAQSVNEILSGDGPVPITAGLCVDGCDGAEPGYEFGTPALCAFIEEEDEFIEEIFRTLVDNGCVQTTNCSNSFCKPLNGDVMVNTTELFGTNSGVSGVGTCHQCPADGGAETILEVCGFIGDEAIENEYCREATGCSHSYCKSNNVCYSCEDDGASTPLMACDMIENPTIADAYCKSSLGTNCRESYCKDNGFCKSCNQEPTGNEPLPCAYEVDFDDVGNWDDWCSQDCDAEISFAVCQPNNLCSPCQPSPVFAGEDRIENPEEPECRQGFLFGAEDEFHLISRNGEGDMGCISDQECIDNTSEGSWCKSDGTCAGCGDWEGCCVTNAVGPV